MGGNRDIRISVVANHLLRLANDIHTLWYSVDADKNVARQICTKGRMLMYVGGWIKPVTRPLIDDLNDWRARNIRDRLQDQLQDTFDVRANEFWRSERAHAATA